MDGWKPALYWTAGETQWKSSMSAVRRDKGAFLWISLFFTWRRDLGMVLNPNFCNGHLAASVDIDCSAIMNHSYLLKGFNRWVSEGLTDGFDVPDLIELRHCTNSTHIYTTRGYCLWIKLCLLGLRVRKVWNSSWMFWVVRTSQVLFLVWLRFPLNEFSFEYIT